MEENAKKIGLLNSVALLVAFIGLLIVSTLLVHSAAGLLATVIAGLGLLVAIMNYFQMRLEERERFEKLELEEMSQARGGESLFTSAGGDVFPAQRSRELFERYFVPAFTILLFFLQAFAAYFHWKFLKTMPPLIIANVPLSVAFVSLFFIVLFLLGRYSSGLARLQKQRLLRPSATYALLSAYACALVAISLGAALARFPRLDMIVAQALTVVVGLIALETLLSLVMEIYRVRVKGAEVRVLYESRLVALLGKPEAIFSTAAHALDYQFGFKVSDTWFFRFLEKSLPMLVAVQIGLLLLFSCVVFINTGEQGLLERLGKPLPNQEVLQPGVHLKMPWPIDTVQRVQTGRIQTFTVGESDEEEGEEHGHGETVLWSAAHGKEDNLLVASHEKIVLGETNAAAGFKSPPVNLIAIGVPVQFQITNLVDWTYINLDPDKLLKQLAFRELVRYLASADLNELMSHGRALAGQALRQRIQESANSHHLGVKIIFAGVADIHPPVVVAPDFEQVTVMMQINAAATNLAAANAIATNAMARVEYIKKTSEAKSEREQLKMDATASAALFTNQMMAFKAAPEIYRQRASLETLVRGARLARKYIRAVTNTSEVIQLNLEDKQPFDVGSTPVPKKKES